MMASAPMAVISVGWTGITWGFITGKIVGVDMVPWGVGMIPIRANPSLILSSYITRNREIWYNCLDLGVVVVKITRGINICKGFYSMVQKIE